MSEHKPLPPNFVPEEDLSMHENFAPIIAENGLIRQPEVPDKETILTASLTRIDTLQDLVQIRQAEKKEKTLPPQPVPQELTSSAPEAKTVPAPAVPSNPEHSFAITSEEKPTLDLSSDPQEGADGKRLGEEKIAQTTTLPAVIPAATTALMTTGKTKRRKSGLFKKRKKAKKHAKPQAQSPATPPATPAPKQGHNSRRWPWVLAVLLFLFLGSITGLVPVEKIPFLRSVAYALGFTKDDTSRISFLRALLAWADKAIGLPGDWSVDSSSLLAGKLGSGLGISTDAENIADLNARMTRYNGQTSLINMAALQKLQREKGRPQDGLLGAVMPAPGQAEAQAAPAQLIGDHVEVRTESTRVQGDVYFGSDAGAINRDARDAYDSSKTLAKVKNPRIADGKPIDWFVNTTQRLMQTTGPLGGANRQLEGTRISWGDNVSTVGDRKERRDLYRAWITSRMSKYTSNLMLKKSLADVGFLGADIPMMVAMSVGGGVQIDAASFQEDQEGWKEYLEFERKCQEALNTAGNRIHNTVQEFNTLVKSNSQWDFPANCTEAYPAAPSYQQSRFQAGISRIASYCKQINTDYTTLENKCYLQVNRPQNVCDKGIQTTYQAHWNNFVGACKNEFDKAFKKWFDEMWWPQKGAQYAPLTREQVWEAQREQLRPGYQNGAWQQDGKQYKQKNYIDSYVTFNNSTNYPSNGEVTMADVVKDQQGGSGNYFPTEDKDNMSQMIVNQMTENKTL